MSQWLLNTATAAALQLPFLVVLGLHYDVLRRHNFLLGGAFACALSVSVWAAGEGFAFALVATVALAATLCVLTFAEVLCYAPLERRGANADEILIASLGLNLVLEQILSMTFGDQIKFLPSSDDPLLGQLSVGAPIETVAPLALALLVVVYFVLTRTEGGARLVAMGANPLLFRSIGFRTEIWKFVALTIIAIALALSALASVGVSGAYPTAGFSLVVLGFLARLVGGPVHRWRFVAAALGIIAFDQVAATLLPGQFRSLVLFGALLFAISVRARSIRTVSD